MALRIALTLCVVCLAALSDAAGPRRALLQPVQEVQVGDPNVAVTEAGATAASEGSGFYTTASDTNLDKEAAVSTAGVQGVADPGVAVDATGHRAHYGHVQAHCVGVTVDDSGNDVATGQPCVNPDAANPNGVANGALGTVGSTIG